MAYQSDIGIYDADPARAASAIMRHMPHDACKKAQAAIMAWDGYRASPLIALTTLTKQMHVGGIYYLDESERFGLGSFKALGGAYAVMVCAARYLTSKGIDVDMVALGKGAYAAHLADYTVCTATDGNHGRAVAWGAKHVGCRAVIYIHAMVSHGRKKAMEAYGATVIRVEGNYDDSVRSAKQDATGFGWQVISDTSYEDYMEVPALVLQGYSLMVEEALAQMPQPPTHVLVQGGVGALAAAVAGWLWHRFGASMPQVILCEPSEAACLKASFDAGKPIVVNGVLDTIMAGLACGEVSAMAWEMLNGTVSAAISMEDQAAIDCMRDLAFERLAPKAIVAGESAVAGLAGLRAAHQQPDKWHALGLGATSHILVFGTEGDTDPELYAHLVGESASNIRQMAAA